MNSYFSWTASSSFCKSVAIAAACMAPMLLHAQVLTQCIAPRSAFQDFSCEALKPSTLVTPGISAAGSQFISKPAGFGTGAEGYGYHYGVSVADNVNGKFMRNFAIPLLAHRRRQPYYYVGWKNARFLKRMANAALHSAIADPASQLNLDNFNWSGAPSSLGSAVLSDAYQPTEQRTLSATFQRFGTNALTFAGNDFASEMLCGVPLLHYFVTCLRR
jgi:hypothetical protein